jgi:predicted nucleotidyltransferase
MNQDFKDLLRLFAEQRVEYLIVGGYAVMHHAQPRYTKDLDLWIRPDQDNSQRVAKALGLFGVPLIDVTAEDFAQEGLQFMIGLPPCAVDFLTTVEGLTFEEAWASRVESAIDEIPVFYLSIPDLIATKRTVARPQDIADIDEIERTMKRSRG